jgi:hypothetical protein
LLRRPQEIPWEISGGIHERLNKMMRLSNKIGEMGTAQRSARKRICSQLLVLLGLGTMVLAVCSLLLGCGSDSTPGGSVKGKNAKTSSTPDAKKSPAPAMVLMEGKKGPEAGKMGDIQKQPDQNSVLVNGLTLQEMEARNEAAVKMLRSPGMEAMPGVTREEMDRRNAEAEKMSRSQNVEVMPGVNLEEMKRRNAAAVEMLRSQNVEVMPGVTLEEMKRKNAAAAANAPGKPPVVQGKREISPPAGGK